MGVLIRNFKNIFLVPELRKKIIFTLGVLGIYRFGVHIPIPGIDTLKLASYMDQVGSGGLLGWFDLISGGALRNFAIFALGINPYITASILMYMLVASIPSLEQLSKEGESGRKIINQYTRYLTLFLSIVQGASITVMAEAKGFAMHPGWGFRLTSIFILSVGSLFVMWMGEQIGLHGIGNGSSLIIFGNIVARIPDGMVRFFTDIHLGQLEPLIALIMLLIVAAVTACVVFIERGERKIPVQYAKRVVGNKMYGGQSSYIPLKINVSGVLPVILAGSVMTLPMMIIGFLSKRFTWLEGLAEAFAYRSFLYNVLLGSLIVFFAFFWAAVQLNPEEVAENMRKSGGFIPGIRPGRKTAEFFNYVLTRVTFPGGMYLAGLTIAPDLLSAVFNTPALFSGVSLLIAVGVALDTSAQIETFLIERRYEGFISGGRLKGRGAR